MTDKPSPTAAPVSRGPSVKQMAIVVVILGVGILLTALTSDVTKVSEPGIQLVPSLTVTNGVTITNEVPFLPVSAGDWAGGEWLGLTAEERAILPSDTEGARRTYRNKAGAELHCTVILAGKDVTSIHRPEVCLPGQGWKIQPEGVETIPTPAAPGGKLQVMRMSASRSVPLENNQTAHSRLVVAYWFVGKDRLTPHHWQRILWTTKDRLLHNRNHRWAYFLITASVKDAQSNHELKHENDAAMRTISEFVVTMFPMLMPGQGTGK
jgi:EpsI family protein